MNEISKSKDSTKNNIHKKASIGFDRVGDSYERGRPEYPLDAVSFLTSNLNINQHSTVVDLGAGTGKFTKLISSTGAKIIAIEPVEGMRNKFHQLYPNYQILNGTAEETSLESCSVDVVIAAQAFHWFDGKKALKEIHRILRNNGKIGLIWNARDESINWISELTKIIDPYEEGSPRYKTMNWRMAFQETHLFTKLQATNFSYKQIGTIETIIDRVESISFIAALESHKKSKVLHEVRLLLESHPETRGKSEITLPYRTDVFWCEKVF